MKTYTLLIILSLSVALAIAAPKSYRQIALDAIADGDYRRAAEFYAKWVEADPTDAVSLYNLACCRAILKQPDAAMRTLELAVEAGWSDSAHAMSDPDLETIRERPQFKTAIQRMAHNAATADGGYIAHTCRQERQGKYLVVLPEEYDPARRYPLIVLLHGYGVSAVDFASVTSLINLHDFIYAIPEGSYPARDSDGKGFSHLRERADFSEDPSSAESSAHWVVNVADDVMKRYPVAGDRFWMVGFSQGGALAHLTAAYHPLRVAGYCAHGGYFIKNTITPAQLTAEKTAGVKVLITHGREDRLVGFEEAVVATNALQQAGLDVKLEVMDVPHRFAPEVGLKVNLWLQEKLAK